MHLEGLFGHTAPLKHIFAHRSIATFVVDSQHRVVFWNEACAELTGTRAEQVLGREGAWRGFSSHERPCLADLMIDNQLAEAHEHYSKHRPSAKAPDAWHAEGWSDLPNGKRCYLVSDAHPVMDEKGRLAAVVETVEDITEFIQPESADFHDSTSLQAILDNAPVGIWLLGLDGRLRFVNQTFCNATGIAEERFLAAGHYAEVMPGETAVSCMLSDRACLEQEAPHLSRETLVFADGKPHTLEITKVKLRDARGEVAGIIGMAMDVTEREQARKHMELAAKVFDNMSEAIIVTDAQNNIVSVNRAFTRITGYVPEDVLGRNPRVLGSGLQPKAYYQQMWSVLLEQGHWHGELWNRRKSGEFYPQQLTIDVIRDETGKVTHHMAVSADISERISAQERIQYLASHDPLTGLPNRATLVDRLRQSILLAARNGQQMAVIFLDLDHFKNINDTLGHAVGDKLLCEVAEKLQGSIRQIDTVSRLGGDEFVIVLPELDGPEGAARVTHAILDTLRVPIEVDGRRLHITPSIGIAMYPRDGKDVHELMKNADNAMYHAKNDGRNTFRLFSSEMNVLIHQRYEIEAALHNALLRDELELFYQPQVCGKTGRLTGAEALIRWHHPERGLVAPGEFIGIAEETGVIVPIGRWALEQACRQHVAWRDAGYPLRISVNLSVRQFQLEDLPELIMSTLQATGMEARYLEVEITEGMLLNRSAQVMEKLGKLTEMGVTIALDDFGTGYSSLNYLRSYPIKMLKIDKCFVKGIDTDATNYAITKSIIELAQALKLTTVAEGVEEAAQVEVLNDLGCESLQGFYHSRPVPPQEFVSVFEKFGL